MASTTFVNGVTLSDADWFNDADATEYDGLTTQILVGGGAGTEAVWTTATGTGAPVRAGAPTFTSNITFSAASAKIIPGATSLLLRNNADTATRITYLDNGDSFSNVINPVSSNVAGWALWASGLGVFSVTGGDAVAINRKTDDGNLVTLSQDGSLEGTISVAVNTVSYNAFLGSHWAQLHDGSKPAILRGTVMETLDELCEWPGEENEKLPKVKISDTAGSSKVYGVFLDWDNDDLRSIDEDGNKVRTKQPTNDMYVAAVGTFLCRMQKGQSYQNGLLVESAGDGTARVQEAQMYGANTLGKIISAVVVETYEDGSFLVPCKLDAG